MKINKFILIFLGLAFAAGSGRAQDKLVLKDALAAALKNNFDIRLSKKDAADAVLKNNKGEAGFYPSISAEAGQNNSLRTVENPASFLQGDMLNYDIEPRLVLNWNLFNGFAAKIDKERLEMLQAQSEGNLQLLVENTLQQVVKAYYRAQLEQARLQISEKLMRLSSDKFQYVKIKKELGSAVTTDLLLEQSNYLTDSSRVVNGRLALRNALRDLNVLLGEQEINRQYVLDDIPAEIRILSPADSLYNLAENNNIGIKNRKLANQVLDNAAARRRAEALPTLSLRSSYAYNVTMQDLSNATFLDGRRGTAGKAGTKTLSAGFTFSVPIFNGGKIKRAVQSAGIQSEKGRLEEQKLKLMLQKDMAAAYDLYNVRADLLSISRQNKTAAETNLELARERFKTGTINSFDFRQLQNNYLNAAFDESEAGFNLISAETDILRLTGELMELAK